MKKKLGIRAFTTVVLLLVILGLWYYTYLNNKTANQQEVTQLSETEKLLQYDMDADYPKTVRETVKLHLRYLKCAYNGEFTEDELFTVNQKIRCLLDEDLLDYNPEEKQLQGLKDDVADYTENKKRFVSYTLAEGSQVTYNTENGEDYAKMKVTINLKAGSTQASGEEEYLLHKDADERWKIVGWQIVSSDTESKGDTE